jgi:hypothetical protein
MCTLSDQQKGIVGIITLIIIALICLTGIIFSGNNLNVDCVQHRCSYTNNMNIDQYGCIVKTLTNGTKNSCEYFFRPCPVDKSTPCYIYRNSRCPLIGSCINVGYSTLLIMSVIGFIFSLMFLVLVVRTYIKRVQHIML